MDFETLQYAVDDGVLTLALNRPDRMNAFTETMRAELIADDDVRAVVVTGAGRAFCAGADVGGGGSTFDWRDRERDTLDDGTPRDGGGQTSGSRRPWNGWRRGVSSPRRRHWPTASSAASTRRRSCSVRHRRWRTRSPMTSRGQSADAREGVTAFLEKRPASFPDRVSDGLPDVFG